MYLYVQRHLALEGLVVPYDTLYQRIQPLGTAILCFLPHGCNGFFVGTAQGGFTGEASCLHCVGLAMGLCVFVPC